MRFWRVCLVLFALALPGTAQAEERFALLIGNSRYEEATPLRNPENDIGAVAESLEAVGFRTTRIENARREGMQRALDGFLAEVKGSERPIVLFYFAGHGVQHEGKNYLLPVDASVDDPEQLAATSLDADNVLARLGEVGAELRIVVMDACRDNPFQKNDRSAVPLASGLAERPQASGQILAYSTAPGQKATDGDTGTSPYAAAFAEAVLMPGLTVRGVFDRVREKVYERTKGAQEPWEAAATYKNLYFVPPADTAEIAEVEALLWDNAALLDSAESYHRYITRFPNGRFAALAQKKIDSINKDFSFRKSADIFPIVTTLDETYLNFCGNYPLTPRNIEAWWQFQQFDKQVIYIDIFIPLSGIRCPNNSTDAPEVTEYAPLGGECGLIPGIDLPNLREPGCRRNVADAPAEDRLTAIVDKGVVQFSGAGYDIYLSAMGSDYYQWQGEAAEGQPEHAFVRATGLVRVDFPPMEEEAFSLFLEPVDPAEFGLTWKHQNTLKAYGDGELPTSAVLDISSPAFVESMQAESALPIRSYWSHEGKVLALKGDDSYSEFTYVDPGRELTTIGVKPGIEALSGQTGPQERLDVLLASGADLGIDSKRLAEQIKDAFVGGAYHLSADCAPAHYEVIGYFENGRRKLVLAGDSPRINERCEIEGTERVRFTLDYLASDNPPPEFRKLFDLDKVADAPAGNPPSSDEFAEEGSAEVDAEEQVEPAD